MDEKDWNRNDDAARRGFSRIALFWNDVCWVRSGETMFLDRQRGNEGEGRDGERRNDTVRDLKRQ